MFYSHFIEYILFNINIVSSFTNMSHVLDETKSRMVINASMTMNYVLFILD